jgi:hypothetical protein
LKEMARQFKADLSPSGSFGLPAAISPRRSCVSSGLAAGHKLPNLPKLAVFGEPVLASPPGDRPTQTASDPGSILAPPLLTTR